MNMWIFAEKLKILSSRQQWTREWVRKVMQILFSTYSNFFSRSRERTAKAVYISNSIYIDESGMFAECTLVKQLHTV